MCVDMSAVAHAYSTAVPTVQHCAEAEAGTQEAASNTEMDMKMEKGDGETDTKLVKMASDPGAPSASEFACRVLSHAPFFPELVSAMRCR